jgi:hypothetical protein
MNLVLLALSFVLFLFSAGEALQVSGLSYIDNCRPGDKKYVKIILINDKDQAETIDLKLCDYSCNKEGQHFFDAVGSQSKSNAAWITFPMPQITLTPREQYELTAVIEVPLDAPSNGSYWSVLLIEPADPIEAINESEKGLQLRIKIRYAFHFVTTLGNEAPRLKILNKELKTLNEKKMIAIDVENIGPVFLNPKLTLKLFNKAGKLEKTIEGQSERIYPANTSRYFLDGEGVEGKTYKAFLLFDNGDHHLFGDTFEITF